MLITQPKVKKIHEEVVEEEKENKKNEIIKKTLKEELKLYKEKLRAGQKERKQKEKERAASATPTSEHQLKKWQIAKKKTIKKHLKELASTLNEDERQHFHNEVGIMLELVNSPNY